MRLLFKIPIDRAGNNQLQEKLRYSGIIDPRITEGLNASLLLVQYPDHCGVGCRKLKKKISNLNQHPREGDGCCEQVMAHDVINAASLLSRRAQSSRVHICATKYWQLITTCTCTNLSQ